MFAIKFINQTNCSSNCLPMNPFVKISVILKKLIITVSVLSVLLVLLSFMNFIRHYLWAHKSQLTLGYNCILCVESMALIVVIVRLRYDIHYLSTDRKAINFSYNLNTYLALVILEAMLITRMIFIECKSLSLKS